MGFSVKDQRRRLTPRALVSADCLKTGRTCGNVLDFAALLSPAVLSGHTLNLPPAKTHIWQIYWQKHLTEIGADANDNHSQIKGVKL